MDDFKVVLGDITSAKTDVIVNAAKSSLAGGSGVDGAIHKAAGPSVLKACLEIEQCDGVRCPVGEAKVTRSGHLDCKFIIHTVGPIYRDYSNPEELLRSAYTNCIKTALELKCKSIAFPAISCGKYGYPYEEAIEIAINTLEPYLKTGLQIYFYLVEQDLYKMYLDKLKLLRKGI